MVQCESHSSFLRSVASAYFHRIYHLILLTEGYNTALESRALSPGLIAEASLNLMLAFL